MKPPDIFFTTAERVLNSLFEETFIRAPRFFKGLEKVGYTTLSRQKPPSGEQPIQEEEQKKKPARVYSILQTPYEAAGFGDIAVNLFDLYQELGDVEQVLSFERRAGIQRLSMLPNDLIRSVISGNGSQQDARERFNRILREMAEEDS